jgi:hypothetical protein
MAEKTMSELTRRITKTKKFRVSLTLALVFLVYLILFATDSENDVFSVAGGFVGGCSAVSLFPEAFLFFFIFAF